MPAQLREGQDELCSHGAHKFSLVKNLMLSAFHALIKHKSSQICAFLCNTEKAENTFSIINKKKKRCIVFPGRVSPLLVKITLSQSKCRYFANVTFKAEKQDKKFKTMISVKEICSRDTCEKFLPSLKVEFTTNQRALNYPLGKFTTVELFLHKFQQVVLVIPVTFLSAL